MNINENNIKYLKRNINYYILITNLQHRKIH